MNKRISRLLLLLAGAACFLFYALHHPEGSWPWPNAVTYFIYGLYVLMMLFLLAAPAKK